MLKEKIESDIKDAMRAKDSLRLSVLRMLMSAVKNKEIDLRKKEDGLADEEVLEVMRYEVKKRKDSIEEFKKGERLDLAEKEAKELEILTAYLPPEISDQEISRIVEEGLRESGASGSEDFGKAMKVIMPVLKGKASGDRISAILRDKLGKL
ncbi:MAG: glutamyl-tRNA amidotransferase [Candidatus Niyogibacteria bacterium CG10_big_fil_rev_8_21_14_0_10_42_19]|uniref:Glutamyl-tRNA amidotransferase n=1 Tax=Candidatus Niyogibacteria bacterium CG10_big_fil_rev_8_21_14_0_10_42_19 TaxID=1974725 RepID=A0A2H0TIA8_9BACT|nr:MAG: glutamyl-tRNA amidotransferase [Candidatus Niyogibacteria bacterium CG10_big_fil_rev_8_21_14_0_10_42_19]